MVYRIHSNLAKGNISPETPDCWSYRLDDLKRGDVVEIRGYKDDIDKQVYAVYLCITARPGGEIPASQNPGRLKNHDPYHVVANARQKWEYEGIPIPPGIIARNFKLNGHPPPPKPIELRDPPKDR